jgi:hypothetical protein
MAGQNFPKVKPLCDEVKIFLSLIVWKISAVGSQGRVVCNQRWAILASPRGEGQEQPILSSYKKIGRQNFPSKKPPPLQGRPVVFIECGELDTPTHPHTHTPTHTHTHTQFSFNFFFVLDLQRLVKRRCSLETLLTFAIYPTRNRTQRYPSTLMKEHKLETTHTHTHTHTHSFP